MPLVTVLNPNDVDVAGTGGPYPAFSTKVVNISGAQMSNLITTSGVVIYESAPAPREVARAAAVLIAVSTPGGFGADLLNFLNSLA